MNLLEEFKLEQNDDLSRKVIGIMIEVHRHLGPGLFESVYEEVLAFELRQRGINYQRQKIIGCEYKGLVMDFGFKADLVVEENLIIEIKSVEVLKPVHAKQLMTYLRLSSVRTGLLVNFNEAYLKDGIKRIVM